MHRTRTRRSADVTTMVSAFSIKGRQGVVVAVFLFGFVSMLTLHTFWKSISVYGMYDDSTYSGSTLMVSGDESSSSISEERISSSMVLRQREQALEFAKEEAASVQSLPDSYKAYLPVTSANHVNDSSQILDRNFQPYPDRLEYTGPSSSRVSFCLPWDTNSDEWWAHHPLWEMGAENDTHYCFDVITDSGVRNWYKIIYDVNFHGDCSNTKTKRMWNSGWNANLFNVIDGLNYVIKKKQPMQIVESRWNYADPSVKPTKDNRGVPPACPRANMFCFFLPISNCQPAPTGAKGSFWEESRMLDTKRQILYNYATRPQTWLRKAIYDFVRKQEQSIPIVEPCAVMHVRRGDVLSDTGNHIRQYHPIGEYINLTRNAIHKNILLLTDDQNAITEAKTEFPQYNWMYMDRPRYRGNEAGWERLIPSNDASFEVTVLLATFKLAAKHCTQLVHSSSGFAGLLRRHMRRSTIFFDLDAGKKKSQIFNKKYRSSANVSLAYQQQEEETEEE